MGFYKFKNDADLALFNQNNASFSKIGIALHGKDNSVTIEFEISSNTHFHDCFNQPTPHLRDPSAPYSAHVSLTPDQLELLILYYMDKSTDNKQIEHLMEALEEAQTLSSHIFNRTASKKELPKSETPKIDRGKLKTPKLG